MADTLFERLKRSWNVFLEKPEVRETRSYFYSSSYTKPDRIHVQTGNERTMVSAIYNRLSVDAASANLRHVKVDENGRFKEFVSSGLDRCLSYKANADQTGRSFIQDAVLSLLDEGSIAIVPVEREGAVGDPLIKYDVKSLRVGKIVQWHEHSVRVSVYNEAVGKKQEVDLPKELVAIVENPFFAVMNEPNSTLKRLVEKLNILDSIDAQNGSGKLDLIIQLPYVVKTEARKIQAENRRKDIEDQLSGSKYGIAYTDGTERITQLNRPAENNLMGQIEYLTKQLYSQLGIAEDIFNGTPSEQVLANYFTRTVEPILAAISEAMTTTFIGEEGRENNETVMFFRDPFRLIAVSEIAKIADIFTRNEILSTNDIRAIIGLRPSSDPAADELRNKNLNPAAGSVPEAEDQTVE